MAVGIIYWRYRVALAHGGPPRDSDRLALEPDEQGAAGDTIAGCHVHVVTVPSNGEATGISIFIASRTTSGCRARMSSPAWTSNG